jgi:glycosyltransferase involved in cell wall biosynthesis
MFGNFPFPQGYEFVEYFRKPDPQTLLNLYQTSHIFLSPSVLEGWGLPIMEAMACGCAVVATSTGCVPVLEKDGNLLAAPPHDRETLFDHINSLVENPSKLQEVAQRGYETVLNHSWNRFSKQFENVLARSISAKLAG